MIKITKKQVEAIENLPPIERYHHSIKMIADREYLYSLLDNNGNWELAKAEGETLFFIWSAEEYAQLFLTDQWKESIVEKVTVSELNDEILPFLNEHGYLLNIHAVSNKSGFVVTPTEFSNDLNNELENYL